jgi:hypothetical protein
VASLTPAAFAMSVMLVFRRVELGMRLNLARRGSDDHWIIAPRLRTRNAGPVPVKSATSVSCLS